MTHTHLRKYMSRRTRGARLLGLTAVFVIGYLCSLGIAVYTYLAAPTSWNGDVADKGGGEVDILAHTLEAGAQEVIRIGNSVKNDYISPEIVGRHLLAANKSDGSYPDAVFTLEQREDGAVVLHVLGMIYMFIALAIVCDEFFVPSLGVITEKLDISEDVSGATFMAAGGSAPELFTSIIGVFIAKNDVGIGTIVGSAVFNILFVIGMCALFSKEVLKLTWWPLFRDVTFYSISLMFLIGFFSDDIIYWWEALLLFLCYLSYVIFMKFNSKVEVRFKSCLQRCKCAGNKVNNSDQLLNERQGRQERSASLPFIHSGSGHYRHGMVQLMIHTIDPLAEAKVHDKAMQLQATLQVIVNPENEHGANNNNASRGDQDHNMQIKVISNGKMPQNGVDSPNTQTGTIAGGLTDREQDTGSKVTSRDVNMSIQNSPNRTDNSNSPAAANDAPSLEEEEEPLDMSWPKTARKRITYVLLAPIVVPLWITLPDVRRPERRKYFPVTFIGSILWIGGFSYCMVWWANRTGETIGINDEVMGLTILAAGTSIPDLITSVIVAKKGFGDMAVSSSVGSNIFDITVGLPVPWMLFSAVNSGDPYSVNSDGLLCSIFLLFIMLIAVVVCIAVSGWKMSKILGVSMMALYLVFVTLAVLLEFGTITCPSM